MSRPRKYIDPAEAVANVLEHALAAYTSGGRWIDRLGPLAAPLADLRAKIVADLGGEKRVSEIKSHMIELAIKTRLIIGSLDEVIFSLPSIINKSRKTVHPAITQRQKMVDELSRLYEKIGIDLDSGATETFEEYITKKFGKKATERVMGPGALQPAIETTAIAETAEVEVEPVNGSGNGVHHFPTTTRQRSEARRAAGRARLPRRFPDDMDDVPEEYEQLLNWHLREEIE